MAEKEQITRLPGSDAPVAPGRMNAFIDSLIGYVIDPAQWNTLVTEIAKLDANIVSRDPAELLAELSRAESLSWQIKQEAGDLTGSQFAYVLLDEQDQTTGSSDNVHLLSDYLTTAGNGQKLRFASEESRISFEDAKARLNTSAGGHMLVELSNKNNNRRRYGYLVTQHELPSALKVIANGASRALLIAQDQPSDKLAHIVRTSFGLTSAETDLTLKIASGITLKEAAEDLNISINTARNHLQSVFDKSGINRQGDLLLVATQLSVILAATDDEVPAAAADLPPASLRVPAQHFIVLPDGRRLAYRTYGDPMGYPVIYLHETVGSSRLPPGTDLDARARGLYLIAFERPGTGFSDACDRYSFESVADDQNTLLNHLRIKRCAVVGFLSGGAYAIVFADRYPDRVDRLFLAAARPPTFANQKSDPMWILRKALGKRPWFLSTFLNILRNRSSRETNARLIESIYGLVPHDLDFLNSSPAVLTHMIDYTMESMTVSVAGIISELRCFAEKRGYSLDRLRAPITIWHGTADRLSSLEDLQRYLGPKITELKTFEGAGSLVLLRHWQAALDDLAGHCDSGSN